MKAREQLMNKISDISGLIRSELPKLNVEKGEFEEITNAILNEDGKSVTLEIVDKLEEYKESLRNKNVQDKR